MARFVDFSDTRSQTLGIKIPEIVIIVNKISGGHGKYDFGMHADLNVHKWEADEMVISPQIASKIWQILIELKTRKKAKVIVTEKSQSDNDAKAGKENKKNVTTE